MHHDKKQRLLSFAPKQRSNDRTKPEHAFVNCPICQRSVPRLTVNFHIDECLSKGSGQHDEIRGINLTTQQCHEELKLGKHESNVQRDQASSPSAPLIPETDPAPLNQPMKLLVPMTGMWSGPAVYQTQADPPMTCTGGAHRYNPTQV